MSGLGHPNVILASTMIPSRMFPMLRSSHAVSILFGSIGLLASVIPAQSAPASYASHPPVRPLPTALNEAVTNGAKRFVDAARGNDTGEGTEKAPWKSLAVATRRLQPGDTLYLRGGTYYEKVSLTRSGTPEAPITIASYPGEMAIIDGGLREFYESPATSWEPFAGGAEGEFVSTKSYIEADSRRVPRQFLPASWEPMWGIEDERPLALGSFGDSMLPLHGYRFIQDLRAKNELWVTGGKKEVSEIYCGPGLWFNRETGRVHIRLAHQQLAGLGNVAYRGETDPRKLPLVIALGFGDDVFRMSGIKHVRLHGLQFRGATGSPMIQIYGSEGLAIDHCTIFGGFPGVLIDASKNIRVTHSAIRGSAAPWTSRAHMKYRGTATYQIVLQNSQPSNEDIEFASCEFTDDHDFAFLRYVKNLQFHHNFVDNFNDDGLEVGPKLRSHTLFIFQNRIGRILSPFTQHEGDKDESPVDHDPKSGAFIFRNVIDLRGGTFKSPPNAEDPSGDYLRQEGHLAGDHGSPIWSVMYVYQNTLLRDTPTFRNYFLFGLGTDGMRNTERNVFNNIFVQSSAVPGAVVVMKQAENLREGGNLLWGVKEGPALQGDPFAKFRASPLFKGSQERYEAGWTTHDRVADPKFVSFKPEPAAPVDLSLQAGSPAIDGGQPVPPDWPDPLRSADKNAPDIGVLPMGCSAWGVGIDGRIPLFGGPASR